MFAAHEIIDFCVTEGWLSLKAALPLT